VIYNTLRSASTTGISLRAATPTKISGRIDDQALDRHLNFKRLQRCKKEIDAPDRSLAAADQASQLKSAEALLATLCKRLDKPITDDLKRQIVKTVVERITADTVERWGVPQSTITVTYRFVQPSEAAAVILPQSYRLHSRCRPPGRTEHIGRPLRRRRAEQIRVGAQRLPTSVDSERVTAHPEVTSECPTIRPGTGRL
jgi:hypothetical protein